MSIAELFRRIIHGWRAAAAADRRRQRNTERMRAVRARARTRAHTENAVRAQAKTAANSAALLAAAENRPLSLSSSKPIGKKERERRAREQRELPLVSVVPVDVRARGLALGLSEQQVDRSLEKWALTKGLTLERAPASALSWLENEARFLGVKPPVSGTDPPTRRVYASGGSPQREAWDRHRMATEGRKYPSDLKGGWWFEAEWPPGHEARRA